ncbi:MAG: hypothetical protein ABJD11_04295 [Gemmatimonadota bacterium]
MPSTRGLVVLGTVLQVIMVLAGHVNRTVLGLSAFLGMGIPFILGAWYGWTHAGTIKGISGAGFVIGIVGAVIGIFVAVMLKDVPWTLLILGSLSSGVTGLLGAAITRALKGERPASA